MTTTDVDHLDHYEFPDTPATCGDCGRPTTYDYRDDAYHHAVAAATGCFLIPAEDRPDDLTHPLVDAEVAHAAECEHEPPHAAADCPDAER